MTKIEIELPDNTAEAAREAGLLTPEALDRLLTLALKRKLAVDNLLSVAARIERVGAPPMAMEEVNAEVRVSRSERGRAGRH